MKEIQARTPGVEMTELISLVEYTQESYDAAVTALIEGALLTVVVVFAFLRNWRATLISALAMPLSILPTFAVMDLLGFTLNGISLLALTLVIGILVDDAIVEIENIERHVDMGKRPFLAAIDAADAIGLAIVATTLTIVAVFAPVSFIGGAVGQYFKQFGLTVAIAVLFSLLVARLLTPLMAAYLLQPRAHHGHSGKPSRIAEAYRRMLGWTLDHRKTALSMVALIFIGSIALLTMLPTGFLPTNDSNVSQLKITLPPGTRLEETARISDDLVAKLKARPEVENVLATADDLNEVSLRIKLKPRKERALDRKSFEMSLRPLLAATPDIQATFSSEQGAKDLSIYLTSDDPEALMASVRRLEKEMRVLPGLVSVQSTEPLLSPELLVKPRFDEAARLGVSVTSIGTVARIATMGDSESNSARFNLGNRQVPIRVMLDQAARGDVDTLRNLRVGTNAGTVVPLTSVADVSFGAEESSVERLDRKRLIAVEANLNGMTLGTAFEAISALPAMTELPAGVSQANYGDAEYMSEMFRNFAFGTACRHPDGRGGSGSPVQGLPAAGYHPGCLAAVDRRGGAGFDPVRCGSRPFVDDRDPDADGDRLQELDPARRPCDRVPQRGRRPAHGPADGGRHPRPTDHHDDHRHGGGHGSGSHRCRRRCRLPGTDGNRRNRRAHHLDGIKPRLRACDVYRDG